jgi:hypothetical protein
MRYTHHYTTRPQQTTLVGAADEQAKPSPYAGMTVEELRAKMRAMVDGWDE